MKSVESAAFPYRVPGGTAWEPADRGGLSTMVCELALRGAGPRDNRSFVNDLDNLGVERGEGVADAHVSFRGATLSKNLYAALAIYADVIRHPHLPEDQLEARRLTDLQDLASARDATAQKGKLGLRRAPASM